MGDKLPDGCLISLTDIPPDFEKHLKLVAERVQAMMISLNEYNRDNRDHDGAVFLHCLLEALTSLYCDAENRPAAAVHLHSLTSVFSEGIGPVLVGRCNGDQVAAHISQQKSGRPNIYVCMKGYHQNRGASPIDITTINALLKSTEGAVTISELPEIMATETITASFIGRDSA